MYKSNYLANKLRSSSVGNEQTIFAWLSDGHTLTYEKLFANAEKIAHVLRTHNVSPGDRVAAQIGKSLTAVELYLGTILAGGVFLPLNTDYTAKEIDYFLSDANPTVFVCDPNNLDVLTNVAKKAGVKGVLTLASDGESGSLLEALNIAPTGIQAVERGPDDLAAILYTSGTTGRSKGAMLSHKALASNASTLVNYWQFTASDRLIHALPIFHIHGLFVAINITLCAGSSLDFMPKFNCDEIITAMKKATVLMGVPTFYVRLLEHPGLTPLSVRHMRVFISGSAPMLAETHTKWQAQTGHAIIERYGMTETNMNTSNPYDGERRPGTVGLPLPGVEVKITHPETGVMLADGGVGQIEVRGPNVFSGYWQMPEKTAEELRSDGWFLTGDLGIKDTQGYISIVGRSKDLIISGGYNVYPKEIESIIDTHPDVLESAVIGLPHADFGEAVVAVIVLNEGVNATEESIKAITQETTAKFKQPKRIFFIKELPRNTMGKVQKAKLRELYHETFSRIA
jgi:malonyl-CoA/methylmalonyl-CoA synthetase